MQFKEQHRANTSRLGCPCEGSAGMRVPSRTPMQCCVCRADTGNSITPVVPAEVGAVPHLHQPSLRCGGGREGVFGWGVAGQGVELGCSH